MVLGTVVVLIFNGHLIEVVLSNLWEELHFGLRERVMELRLRCLSTLRILYLLELVENLLVRWRLVVICSALPLAPAVLLVRCFSWVA